MDAESGHTDVCSATWGVLNSFRLPPLRLFAIDLYRYYPALDHPNLLRSFPAGVLEYGIATSKCRSTCLDVDMREVPEAFEFTSDHHESCVDRRKRLYSRMPTKNVFPTLTPMVIEHLEEALAQEPAVPASDLVSPANALAALEAIRSRYDILVRIPPYDPTLDSLYVQLLQELRQLLHGLDQVHQEHKAQAGILELVITEQRAEIAALKERLAPTPELVPGKRTIELE